MSVRSRQRRQARRHAPAMMASLVLAVAGMSAAQSTPPLPPVATLDAGALLPSVLLTYPQPVPPPAASAPEPAPAAIVVRAQTGPATPAILAENLLDDPPIYRKQLACAYTALPAVGCQPPAETAALPAAANAASGLAMPTWLAVDAAQSMHALADIRWRPVMSLHLSGEGLVLMRQRMTLLAESLRQELIAPAERLWRREMARRGAPAPAHILPARVVHAAGPAPRPAVAYAATVMPGGRGAHPVAAPSTLMPPAVNAAIAAATPVKPTHLAWNRDPFAAPVEPSSSNSVATVRPPGLGGVTLDELDVQAVALGGANGSVALAEGPDKRTYFLRAGSQLMDARVVRVEPDGVVFERSADSADPHAQVLRKVGQGPVGAHTQ